MQSTSDIPALRAKADAGDAAAQEQLGMAYVDGQSVERNNAEGYFWFLLAAAAGSKAARALAGKAAEKLSTTERDYAEMLAPSGSPCRRLKSRRRQVRLPQKCRSLARWKKLLY